MLRLVRHNFFPKALRSAVLALGIVGGTLAAHAQYRPDHIPMGPPSATAAPTIVARPNAQVPLDLEFTNSDGKTVRLADLYGTKRPVIVSLVYFSCPMLCGLNQQALASAVRSGPRGLSLGTDYDVLVVSIDPDDTPKAAAEKRARYLDLTGKPASTPGFTYLTGSEKNIQTLADTLGFGFKRNFGPGDDKFAHATGIFITTPGGRLSKTLLNAVYTSDEVHAALLDAGDNKIGSSLFEAIALPCGAVRFNEKTGMYEHNPWFWAGTAGGLASIAFTAIFLGVLWRGEYKKHRAAKAGGTGPTVVASP